MNKLHSEGKETKICSVLSAIGKGAKWALLFGKKAVGVAQAVTVEGGILSRIALVVGMAENMAERFKISSAGAVKLDAAVQAAGDMIRASELVSGRDIADAVLFESGVRKVVEGVVEVLKSVKAE